LPDVLIRLLPGNPLGSMVEGEMLQVVIFAVIVGIALVAMAPGQSKPLLDLLATVQQVCMTVVRWAMALAPIAVFGLMARLTSQIGLEALGSMALYVGTVLLGLAMMLCVYLLLVFVFARVPPLTFLRGTRELLLLAFSTSSSAAVMPLSIKTAEEKLGVRRSIAQFVIPLGATINMNGTALYQGAAAVFLAQVYDIDISAGGMALIVVMAVGASIGSPATPGVGIVILAMVLSTVGIPAEGVALLMGVDRILDMSRTAINVAGDLVASKLMNCWISDASETERPVHE
jgi:Na+/H+-dicarboxylate symporter